MRLLVAALASPYHASSLVSTAFCEYMESHIIHMDQPCPFSAVLCAVQKGMTTQAPIVLGCLSQMARVHGFVPVEWFGLLRWLIDTRRVIHAPHRGLYPQTGSASSNLASLDPVETDRDWIGRGALFPGKPVMRRLAPYPAEAKHLSSGKSSECGGCTKYAGTSALWTPGNAVPFDFVTLTHTPAQEHHCSHEPL
jgi:hypothetical protein